MYQSSVSSTTQSPQNFHFCWFFLLIITIVLGVKLYLIVGFMCICPVTNKVEQLLICLLTTCILFFMTSLLNHLHIYIYFFLFCSCKSSLHTFATRDTNQIHYLKPFHGFLFHTCDNIFWWTKVYNYDEYQFHFLSLLVFLILCVK
jgi:hypothetical protein